MEDLGVHQELGQHVQHARVDGHRGLVIRSRDDVPHGAEGGGLCPISPCPYLLPYNHLSELL